MKKTNKKILEEIIRVDHAGERGAIKIYEGQLLALKTFKQDEDLKKQIEEMKEHEKEHYNFFDQEIRKRNIKPTKLLPLWDLLGISLGFGTAMLGKKAAMLCSAEQSPLSSTLTNPVSSVTSWKRIILPTSSRWLCCPIDLM